MRSRSLRVTVCLYIVSVPGGISIDTNLEMCKVRFYLHDVELPRHRLVILYPVVGINSEVFTTVSVAPKNYSIG